MTFLLSYQILITAIFQFYFSSNYKEWIRKQKLQVEDLRGEENESFYFGIYNFHDKKVKITFNNDQTLTFSTNSTADIIELANGVAKTKIGFSTLKLIDEAKTKIFLEIDTLNILSRDDGNVSAAETYPIISTPIDRFGNRIGPDYISQAKIIIYEATIKDLVAKNEGKISINGINIDTKDFSISDILASCSLHEFIHVLDYKSSGALNPMSTKMEIEKKPYEFQLQYLKELKEQYRAK